MPCKYKGDPLTLTPAGFLARVIGLWTRVISSTVIVPAVGCGIVVIASAVAAIILATHLDLVKTEDALGSMMQEDMMIKATLQKSDPPFLTAFFDDKHEPFANISLNSKTLPVTVTSLPTTDLNECTWKPCLHGRCVNKDGGYNCICNPGWTGQNCHQDLNECDGNPCEHGRCVNKDGGYKCTCNPGWTGQNCQQDLNECTGNPCQHGRCVNKDGGYTCTCNPEWTGRHCHLAKPCPTGWSGYTNHCYKLMKDAATWEDAKKRCEQLGANLASITSYGEANFMNTIITDAPVGKWGIYLVWFGLHRNDGFRKFTDGSQVFYTNWEPGQPNNNGNIFTGNVGQDCVGMYSKAPARRVLVSGRPQQFRPMGMLLKRRTSRRAGEKGRGNPQRVLRPPFL
ncbi:hypothetical protein Bbelb_343940 [Branchiostoma belcheri]|nr:hypothetical protein Bbelb_343940 [Branchiostoma belcheri]